MDGDQTTTKGVYSKEANAELDKVLNSKMHYINIGGKGIRESDNEAILSLYSLTHCLSDVESKMTKEII